MGDFFGRSSSRLDISVGWKRVAYFALQVERADAVNVTLAARNPQHQSALYSE